MTKVKISVHDIPYSGYINIDPDPIVEEDKGIKNVIKNIYTNIDEYVDDNECLEILAKNILDYIKNDQIESYLLHLRKKINKNGELIIGGTDIDLVLSDYLNGGMNEEKFNLLLFGEQNRPSLFKRGITTLKNIVNISIKCGFVVTEQFSENYNMFVRLKIG